LLQNVQFLWGIPEMSNCSGIFKVTTNYFVNHTQISRWHRWVGTGYNTQCTAL